MQLYSQNVLDHPELTLISAYGIIKLIHLRGRETFRNSFITGLLETISEEPG